MKMQRMPSGSGLVALVVVLTVVLLLSARAWRSHVPPETPPALDGAAIGEKLQEMDRTTSRHARELERVLGGP
ncbi:MAG: hypothetical protein D6718_07815 [Acidobacteria bacterium]|nr:MAG: hypothetical protein D6718_07815 [Acidobacteriota bacterium]